METQRPEERGAQAILIVESDASIRSILDLSLRHAGFAVGLASTNEEAILRLAEGPDLVIAGATDAADLDGLALCRRAKQTGERLPPAVVLISEPGLENKTRGLEAGADDFVVRPIYVQEVVARARALLQRRERERLELSARVSAPSAEGTEAPRPDQFFSDIGDVPLVDLMRAVAAHQRSGVAVITADGGARGEIFFRQGNVVDAEVGRLSGRDAIYRLFCWSAGRLEVEWKSIRRKDTIEMPPQELLMEALRRVDEWHRLLVGLPPLDTVFEVDYRTLAERLADIPDEVNRILRLFDGVRTFLQVIDDCGLPDLDAAAAIGKLCQERIIHDVRLLVPEEETTGSNLEGWLSEATGPFRSPARTERDLFGAPLDGRIVHRRPTAPLEPLGEVLPASSDGEQRARFADRLTAEELLPSEVTEASESGPPPTLPGFGAVSQGQAAPAEPAPAAPDSPAEAAVSAKTAITDDTTAVILEVSKPELSSANAEDAIVSSEDATPIVSPKTLDDALTPPGTEAPGTEAPGTESPPLVDAALPTASEARAASGEIVVRPSKAKSQHSPAAEVRLAHLREENARVIVRPSQTLTPAGTARALDEPPPLADDAQAPELPARPTAQLVRATAVEALAAGTAAAAPDQPDDDDQRPSPSHRRSAIIAGAVGLLVVVGGISWMAARRASPDTAETAPAAPPVVALPTVPATAPAAVATAPAAPPKPADARPVAPSATFDEAEERSEDPKLARAAAAEAGALLVACRTAYQDARMKDAEATCTAARDANPNSAEANGYLAHALLNRNRRRESLAAAERAVKLNPKWADAYVVIGGIHQDAGEMAEARRAYQHYLELEPHGSYAGELRTIVEHLGKP